MYVGVLVIMLLLFITSSYIGNSFWETWSMCRMFCCLNLSFYSIWLCICYLWKIVRNLFIIQ